MIRLFMGLIRFGLFVLSFLAVGFLVYWIAMPESVSAQEVTGQAIVVVTGGQGRVATGIALLDSARAPQLFISGVGRGVTVRDVVREAGGIQNEELMHCCITLGYQATNTYENAEEVASWLKINHMNEIILVSSNYHLPRAELELLMAAPDLKITLFPTDTQTLSHWWQQRSTTEVMVSEYLKTALAFGRYLVARIHAAIGA